MLSVDLYVCGNVVIFCGELVDVVLVEWVIFELIVIVVSGQLLILEVVCYSVVMLVGIGNELLVEVFILDILLCWGKMIWFKMFNQKCYVDVIDVNIIVFGIGLVGIGKIYFVMVKVVYVLQIKQVICIILI